MKITKDSLRVQTTGTLDRMNSRNQTDSTVAALTAVPDGDRLFVQNFSVAADLEIEKDDEFSSKRLSSQTRAVSQERSCKDKPLSHLISPSEIFRLPLRLM